MIWEGESGVDNCCLRARMIFMLGNVHRAQVEGSANKMVAVLATQELEVGDVLLRFKAEASQNYAHGIRSIGARPVFGNCRYTWDSSHLCPVLFFRWFTIFRLMFDIFTRQQHMFAGS